MIEGSAIAAIGALRAQVEERLLQTEDYRALRALDRAIAEIRSPSLKATAPASALTKAPAEEGSAATPPGQLQQKLVEKYNSAAA